MENWLNQLVTNATATLAEDFGDEIRFEDFEEVLPFTPEQLQGVSNYDVVPTLGGAAAKVAFEQGVPVSGLDDSNNGMEQQISRDNVFAERERADDSIALEVNPEVAEAIHAARVVTPQRRRADGFDMSLMPRIEGVNRLVVHTGGKKQAAVAARWLKKNATEAVQALAAWATAVRVVAAKAGLPMDAVGFTFASHAEAEYVRAQGRFALLLNPTNIDLTASDAAEELIDRALHEAAHLVTGSGHDESFVCAEFTMRRKVRGSLTRGAVARALRSSEVQAVEQL